MAQLPQVIPMLSYEDCDAAAAWVANAFGFTEHERYAETRVASRTARCPSGKGSWSQ